MFEGRGRTLILLLILVLAWASWLLRYDLQTVPNTDGYSLAYRLDRWTGNMRMIEDDRFSPVVEGDDDAITPPKSSSMALKRGRRSF